MNKKVAGSAAIEVVLLVAFIILPVYVLLCNMGYNGMRMRETRDALRLGAYLIVDGLATGSREEAKTSAEVTVNSLLFADEPKSATLSVSATSHVPKENLSAFSSFFATVSFWQTVGASVTRTPPYDVFGEAPLRGSIIVGANTFTFCEMRNENYTKGAFGALQNVASKLGKAALWLFGGVADGKDVCS